ncbi:MAG TPA: replication-relaxation family protein [Candidatus Saccharimonadales bacterium]|nr:replication-relaxation family protein [Candidatus Saccharimonadales bacterium]
MKNPNQPRYRKALNPEQLRVLYALYKFRFGTTDLLASTMSKPVTRRYMNERLRILCEQEYIARRYNSSYRLQARFASYHLLPKGIEVLKQRNEPNVFNPLALKNMRNDANVSERFARHCLSIFTAYSKILEIYGDGFKFFTKSYLLSPSFAYFPKPKPDAYIWFEKDEVTGKVRHYLMECFDDTMPQSIMKKRIEYLVEHADSSEWTTSSAYPTVLLVCDRDDLRKKAQKWAAKALEEGWTNELRIVAATYSNLHL